MYCSLYGDQAQACSGPLRPDSPDTRNARQNRLLDVLPESEYHRLDSHLELVQLSLGETLQESGNRLNHVYFPTTAIVSLLHVLQSGASAEIAMVGSMGMVGVALFMGGDTMPNRAVVRSAGLAYRVGGPLLQHEFKRAGALQHLLLRYTLALLTQMAQTAVCIRLHSVDQQLCRARACSA